MSETLTLAEIWQRYPNEWVLLNDVQTDANLALTAGTVLYHSPDRDEVDKQLLALRPGRFAVRYTGELPGDSEFVL